MRRSHVPLRIAILGALLLLGWPSDAPAQLAALGNALPDQCDVDPAGQILAGDGAESGDASARPAPSARSPRPSAPAAVASPAPYTVTDLGTLGGAISNGMGTNEAGQVVGASQSGAFMFAYLWNGGTMTSLGDLGGQGSWAYDVNEAGQVVGGSPLASGSNHAFRWQNGSGMQDLGTLGGPVSYAFEVNSAGQAVGYASNDMGIGHAVLWGSGGIVDLGDLDPLWDNHSGASGINDAGQVVGCSYTDVPGQYHGFLWQNGSMQDLGTLGGRYSCGMAINEDGQVVGDSWLADNTTQRAFLWDGGMQDLGSLGWERSIAYDINDGGQVVGELRTGSASHAFLWADGQMQDLNNLIPQPAEEESPELRLSPVEAEREFVQVGLEVVALHRALVRAQQPSLGEAGDPVDTRKENVGLRAGAGHVDGAVDVVGPDRRGVRLQPIGHHRRARLDGIPQERVQRDGLRVGDHPQAASPEALGLVQLDGHSNERLPRGSSAPFPGADPSEEGLVHLDDAGQAIPARPHHRGTQPVQHGPGRLVGTEPEEAMERERRDTVLRGGHVPGHREPDRERRARAVEDRPGRDRHAATARLAPEAAVLQARAAVAAARTHEATGPPQPLQIVQARVVVREPRAQLRVAARKIAAGDERGGGLLGGHHYILCLPHSNGYPPKFIT